MNPKTKYIVAMSLAGAFVTALLVTLVTNPSEGRFLRYANRLPEARNINEGSTSGPFASFVAFETTNYFVLSVFDATFPGAGKTKTIRARYLGLFGAFIRIE